MSPRFAATDCEHSHYVHIKHDNLDFSWANSDTDRCIHDNFSTNKDSPTTTANDGDSPTKANDSDNTVS